MLVGFEVGLMAGVGLRRDVRGDDRRNRSGDFGLNLEDVLELPVERLVPHLAPARIEKLCRDPQLLARLADAPLQHVAHAEQRADPVNPVIAALEGERRGAADHVQLAEARQPIENLLGHPVAEIVVVGVVADVGEGQHRDRVREALACPARDSSRSLRRSRVRRLANVVHSAKDQHARDCRKRREDQVVAAGERLRLAEARWHRPEPCVGSLADRSRTASQRRAPPESPVPPPTPVPELPRSESRTPETVRRPPAA